MTYQANFNNGQFVGFVDVQVDPTLNTSAPSQHQQNSGSTQQFQSKGPASQQSQPNNGVNTQSPSGGQTSTSLPKMNWRPISDALLPRPKRIHVIHDLISASTLNVLYGDAGKGKSLIALGMAISVSSGLDFLQFKTTQGGVLWVDEDNGQQTTLERMEKALKGYNLIDPPIQFVTEAGFDAGNHEMIDELMVKIQQDNIKLVIIDAWQDILGGKNENGAEEVQPLLANLRKIAEKTESAILLLHHSNKGNGYRGSTALKGKVDLMMKLESTNVKFEIKIMVEKDRLGLSIRNFSTILNFSPNTFYLSPSIGSSNANNILTDPQVIVLKYLKVNPESTMDSIKTGRGTAAESTIDNATRSLCTPKMDYVYKPYESTGGKGNKTTYSLTSKGEDYVNKIQLSI